MDEHHFLMPLVELLDEKLGGIFMQTRKDFLVHASHARGCLAQALAVRVFAHALENEPDTLFYLGGIHLALLLIGIGRRG